MSSSILQLVDELPKDNLTVKVLRALDFVVPGEWQNLTGFHHTIQAITGDSDPAYTQQIAERAVYLCSDPKENYQRALWLYQTTNTAGRALGAAALANKVGEKIGFLSFLNKVTPKADTSQSIDLALKVVVELLAFTQINGIPGDSIGDFASSLGDYSGESLMRMAALVCLDGLIPLGPNFIQKVDQTLSGLNPATLEQNPVFSAMGGMIPGNSSGNKLTFIGSTFDAVRGWMGNLVASREVTQGNVIGHLRNYIDIADDKLDYLAAFLDISTNYYEHTGIQTLARRLIERAVAEI